MAAAADAATAAANAAASIPRASPNGTSGSKEYMEWKTALGQVGTSSGAENISYTLKKSTFDEGDKVVVVDDSLCAIVHETIVPALDKYLEHNIDNGSIQKVVFLFFVHVTSHCALTLAFVDPKKQNNDIYYRFECVMVRCCACACPCARFMWHKTKV